MSEIAIRVENLSKRYRIGQRERYKALRDTLTDAMYAPFRRIRSTFQRSNVPTFKRSNDNYIWALKDVCFEVKRGEVVGIIGRNGAGKTTLLKILSRITEPTEGYAEIHGRVGSLLEVGTGFHPELTGRENIYLSGIILGMKKAEIDKKLDEIVAFAEIEEFLDTPVKYYSSGMYVRLAFAVAAHLEPEILLVDEVLAVGDAAFQKKCLGKMGEVAKEGRTVLFVSHNMAAILNLCPRAILLDAGQIVQEGASDFVVDKYLQAVAVPTNMLISPRTHRSGNRSLRFVAFQLLNEMGEPISKAISGNDLIIALQYEATDRKPLRNVHVAIGIHGRYDENLFHLSTSVSGGDFKEVPPEGIVICRIPRLPLQPGRYSFNLFCMVGGEIADWIQGAGVIEVAPGDFFGSGKMPPIDQGPFLVHHSWDVICREGG